MKKILAALLVISSILGITAGVSAQTATPSSSQATSTQPAVATEKATAYIQSLQIRQGKLYADFDYIEWYTGKAADREFLKDCKECSEPGSPKHAPNNYYIRNVDPQIHTYMIADTAEFILQTRTGEINWNEKVTREDFVLFFLQNENNFDSPFHIEITNGVVTKITEQYVP
ncbi:hypothetical protein [Brevibacillus marinus]|uniref:hypothetical protein n=1 Tax=Brevibacillus marinus TaxID=2496837 RepID=UPI000F81B3DC|nr:hypothetical protein [Brevibacillus marinus]